MVGRLAGVRGGRALFSGGLRNLCALADLKMNRLLALFDAWAQETGVAGEVAPPERFAPSTPDEAPRLDVALGHGGEAGTILWATGFRPDFGWLDLPVFDRRGRLLHDRGVVAGAPGVYVLGLPFLRRRKSSFIHGAGDDVRELCRALADHLHGTASRSVDTNTCKISQGREPANGVA